MSGTQLSDPLEDLKAEIHKHDFTNDTEGEHASYILDLLDNALASKEGELRNLAPPLDVVIYALKSMIFPKFLSCLIPDFLRLFTMLEFYRIRATKAAGNALEFSVFYKHNPNEGNEPLADDDEQFFQHVVESNKEMRQIFLQVATTCVFMDLRKLWLGNSNTDFWKRWNEYLSVLRRTEDRKGGHIFHYNFSSEEVSYLRDACVQFSSLMAAIGQWIEDKQEPDQDISDIFQAQAFLQAFHEQFSTQESTSAIHELVDYHINFVQEVVHRLKPSPTEDPST